MKNLIFVLSLFFLLGAQGETFCPAAPPSCSYAAINDNLKEMDSSWFFDSPNDTCKGAIPKGNSRPSNDKIYTAMMEDPRITNYVNPSILGCFKNSAGTEEQKIRALSRYAYSQARFDKAGEGLQDYLAFADMVNGKVPLDKVNCAKESPEMTKTVEACQRVQSQCKEASATAAQELVDQYESDFKAVDVPNLNKRIKEINSIINASKTTSKGRIPISPEALASLEKELAEKEIRLEMFYSTYPWSRQSTYANAIRQGKGQAAALKLQITENAENAKEQLKEINKASSCMLRNDCDPDDITDALKKVPGVDADSIHLKKGDTRENNYARGAVTNYLSYNRCLDDRVEDWENTNKGIVDKAALPIGLLTIPLTMGGSLALTGLTLGGRAVVSAAAVGSRGFAIATAATRIGTVASAVLAAPQVQTAVQHCGEKAKAELNPSSAKPKNQCSLVDKQSVAFKKRYDDCFMQAVMATLSVGGAGLGLKGLAAGVKSTSAVGATAENATSATSNATVNVEGAADKVQKFIDASKKSSETAQAGGRTVASQEQLKIASGLNDVERVEAASQVLKANDGTVKVLTEAQKKAVVDAHNIGSERGFGTYTKTDLLQKQRVLKNAGFSDAEIEKLMRNGVTGKITEVSVSHGTDGARQLVTVKDHFEHADRTVLAGDFGRAQQSYSSAAEKVTESLNSVGGPKLSNVAAMERPMVYDENISKLMLGERRFQEGASERILAAAAELEKKYQVPSTKTLEREFDALKREADSQAGRVINQNYGNTKYDEATRKWVPMAESEVVNDAAYKAYKANEMRKRLASEAFQQDRISEEMFDRIMAECKTFDQKTGSLKKVRESLGGK